MGLIDFYCSPVLPPLSAKACCYVRQPPPSHSPLSTATSMAPSAKPYCYIRQPQATAPQYCYLYGSLRKALLLYPPATSQPQPSQHWYFYGSVCKALPPSYLS